MPEQAQVRELVEQGRGCQPGVIDQISSLPNARNGFLTSALHRASSLTSVGNDQILQPPCRWHSAATSSSLSMRRAAMATFAPCSAAVPPGHLPIPADAPVMIYKPDHEKHPFSCFAPCSYVFPITML